MLRLGAAGLSLASGLAAWVEYALLRRAVARSIGRTRSAGRQLGRVLAAATAAAAAALLARPLLIEIPPLLGGVAAVGMIAAVYIAAAVLLGVTEIRDVLSALWRRARRR